MRVYDPNVASKLAAFMAAEARMPGAKKCA